MQLIPGLKLRFSSQYWLAMKLTFLLLTVALLQVSAKGLGQGLTLSLKNVKLEKAFAEIEKKSGYNFLYTDQMLEESRRVTIEARDAALETVLEQCFREQPLEYTVIGKTIIVKPKEKKKGNTVVEQEEVPIDVKGRVLNEYGEPVEGASVMVKGTSIGTTTNGDGFFELRGVDAAATLVISGINMYTREVSVDGKTSLSISVRSKVKAEEEVVIRAGYYDVKKREATGSISRITSATIEKQPITNPLQAMQGRMPGVIIQQNAGLPGAAITVQIRGRNSINPGVDRGPLYIIDGVPFSSEKIGQGTVGILIGIDPLNSISPSDIESIEILKDADATAIYGSRGANGVVLITTKKGKAGKTSLDFNFSAGFSQVPHFLGMLSRSQYLEMKIESLKNSNRWPLDPPSYISVPDVFLWDTTRYTNWQKVLLGGTAKTSNGRVALSGGSLNTKYLFSVNYHTQGSVFPGDFAYQKGSSHFNLNHRSENEKFELSLSTNYTIDNNNLPTADLTEEAITLSPTAPSLYDASGEINWENNTWLNPMASYLKKKYRATGENFVTNAIFKYEVIPGLRLMSSFGYNKRHLDQLASIPFSSGRPDGLASFNPYSLFGIGTVKTWIIEPQVEYTYSLGKGKIILLAGTSFQDTRKQNEVKSASGFASDALLENIGAAPEVRISLSDAYQYRYTAGFGRINYNLYDKYILNLTGRKDGSSRFGPDNQFGNFGAVGAAWIFSEEKFFKNLSFLSFGKIRASYGITGSDNIGSYQYLDSYSPTQNPYQGMIGLVPTRLANAEYGWETNKKLEAAVELKFLNRLNAEASYYKTRSSNQLVGYGLPVITGQSSVSRNLPATVQNTGWEFELRSENLKGTVSWFTHVNFSISRNKLIEYNDLENSAYANYYIVGKPLNIVKGYRYTGVDPITGYYTFEDVNRDGFLTPEEDYQVIGDYSADFYLGMNNSISFKGLELNFHLHAVKQTGRNYIMDFYNMPGYVGYSSNQPVQIMDRWQYPGHVTNIQKFGNAGFTAYSNLKKSDRSIADASYIKLRNVQLTYAIPEKWSRKLWMKSANLFVQGQNLMTLTNYVGLDPETQNNRRLPVLRTITVGARISF